MIGLGAIFSSFDSSGDSSGATQLSRPILSASILASNNISLSWNSITNANNYVLERSVDVPDFDVSGETIYDNSSTSFTDTDVFPDTQYYYRVKAQDSSGSFVDSEYSTVQSIIISKLESPSVSSPTQSGEDAVLNWGSVAGATSYTLQRSTTAGFTSPTTVYTGSNTTYTDTTTVYGSTYYYRVKATASGFFDSDYASLGSITITTPQNTDVLDNLTATPYAAYSLNRLTSTAQYPIQVRRSLDDLTFDVPFSNGTVFGEAIVAFCQGSTGYVSKIYDQGSNGLDLIPRGDLNQYAPVIFDGSALQIDDFNNYGMRSFTSANTKMQVSATTTINSDSTIVVAGQNISISPSLDGDAANILAYNPDGANPIKTYYEYRTSTPNHRIASRFNYTSTGVDSKFEFALSEEEGRFNGIFRLDENAGTIVSEDTYNDGVSVTEYVATNGKGGADSSELALFSGRDASPFSFNGYLHTVMLFNSALDSTDIDTMNTWLKDNFVDQGSSQVTQNDPLPALPSAEYSAYIAEGQSQGYTLPDDDGKTALQRAISRLVDYEVYDGLDGLFFGYLSGGSKNFSYINVIDPTGTKSSDVATTTVGWADSSGWTGANGVINTGINLSSATNFAQNDGFVFILGDSSGGYEAGAFGARDASNGFAHIKDSSGQVTIYANDASQTVTPLCNRLFDGGMSGIYRSGASLTHLFSGGDVIADATGSSAGVPNANLYVRGVNNNGTAENKSSDPCYIIAVGGGLASSKFAIMSAIFNAYVREIQDGTIVDLEQYLDLYYDNTATVTSLNEAPKIDGYTYGDIWDATGITFAQRKTVMKYNDNVFKMKSLAASNVGGVVSHYDDGVVSIFRENSGMWIDNAFAYPDNSTINYVGAKSSVENIVNKYYMYPFYHNDENAASHYWFLAGSNMTMNHYYIEISQTNEQKMEAYDAIVDSSTIIDVSGETLRADFLSGLTAGSTIYIYSDSTTSLGKVGGKSYSVVDVTGTKIELDQTLETFTGSETYPIGSSVHIASYFPDDISKADYEQYGGFWFISVNSDPCKIRLFSWQGKDTTGDDYGKLNCYGFKSEKFDQAFFATSSQLHGYYTDNTYLQSREAAIVHFVGATASNSQHVVRKGNASSWGLQIIDTGYQAIGSGGTGFVGAGQRYATATYIHANIYLDFEYVNIDGRANGAGGHRHYTSTGQYPVNPVFTNPVYYRNCTFANCPEFVTLTTNSQKSEFHNCTFTDVSGLSGNHKIMGLNEYYDCLFDNVRVVSYNLRNSIFSSGEAETPIYASGCVFKNRTFILEFPRDAAEFRSGILQIVDCTAEFDLSSMEYFNRLDAPTTNALYQIDINGLRIINSSGGTISSANFSQKMNNVQDTITYANVVTDGNMTGVLFAGSAPPGGGLVDGGGNSINYSGGVSNF